MTGLVRVVWERARRGRRRRRRRGVVSVWRTIVMVWRDVVVDETSWFLMDGSGGV